MNELHAHAWFPLGATIGGKYQLLGQRTEPGFALSLGLDVGYLSVSVDDGNDDDMDNAQTATLVDLYLPVYMGYRFSESVALYGTPKYVLRTAFADETEVSHVAGGTLGFAFGAGTQFFIEGSALYDTGSGAPIFNGAIGKSF